MTAERGQSRDGLPAAVLAAALGTGYGVLNLYWAVGGDALRARYGSHLVGTATVSDTVFRRASLVLAVVFLAAAAAGVRAVTVGWDTPSRPWWRWSAWAAAGLLALYGLGLTLIGLYVQAFGATAAADDGVVQRWHAFFWDPWFLVWGVVLVFALLRSARAYVASGRDLRYVTG